MTILLYSLLVIFILIETPLIMLVRYLLRYYGHNGQVLKLRNIILLIVLTKIFFIFGQILLIGVSLYKSEGGSTFIIWFYTIAAIALCIVNWWAFFRIRKLIK